MGEFCFLRIVITSRPCGKGGANASDGKLNLGDFEAEWKGKWLSCGGQHTRLNATGPHMTRRPSPQVIL